MHSAERRGSTTRALALLAAAGAALSAPSAGQVPLGSAPAAAHAQDTGAPAGRGNAFEVLAPSIVLSRSDWRRLEEDQPVIRTLEGKDAQLAIFVATRLNAPPDALAVWTRAIAELKESRFVLAIGRFSTPPRLSDLDPLLLDDRDLDAIRQCTPDDCGLKLAAADIQALRRVVSSAGAGWKPAVQQEFRRLLLARVEAYREGGLAALAPPADDGESHPPDRTFAALAAASPYLRGVPHLAAWLESYPAIEDPRVESFFYWSKEQYGGGKPVVSLTHVGIVRQEADRRLPAVVVAGKQIFATHYIEGALGLTMVLRDPTGDRTYLAYVNRSQLDILRGFFGGLARRIVEGRVERHAPQIIRGLRERLESGTPAEEKGSGGFFLRRRPPRPLDAASAPDRSPAAPRAAPSTRRTGGRRRRGRGSP